MNIFMMFGRCWTQFSSFVFQSWQICCKQAVMSGSLCKCFPAACCITHKVCSSVERGLRLWAPSPFIYGLGSLGTQRSSLCVCPCQSVVPWLRFVVVQVVQMKLHVWFSLFPLWYFCGFDVWGQDFAEPGWRQKSRTAMESMFRYKYFSFS